MSEKILEEVTKSFTELNTTFEEFKSKNDERLKEIEKKGTADPLLEEQLTKMNEAMDLQQKQIDDFSAAMQRSETAVVDGKTVAMEELDQKAMEWATRATNARSERAPEEFGHKNLEAYDESFGRFLRKNVEQLSLDEMKALSVGSDPDGGYLVTPDRTGRIVKRVYETSPMRQYASVQTISKDSLGGIHDVDEAEAGWVGERQARPETGTPKVNRWMIPLHELYAKPKATQKMLDDADVDVEAWLSNKVADKFARIEASSFVNGDGVDKPRGILAYPDWTAAGSFQLGAIERFGTGVNGAFAAAPDGGDVLLDLIYQGMKAEYLMNANWAMNRTTIGAVRKLKDSDGEYLWANGLQAGEPPTLLNYPVARFEDMPNFSTTGALGIAFGDFREAYQIVDRPGIRVLRDPYVEKPFIQFYSVTRVGGDVVNFEAIKLIEFSA